MVPSLLDWALFLYHLLGGKMKMCGSYERSRHLCLKITKPLSTSKLQNCFCFTAVGFVFSAAAPIETVEGKCLAKMNIGKVLLLWSNKIRSVWELLKLGMFWLNIWESLKPVRLSWYPYASLVSLGLLCAARPHIYFYPLSDASMSVVIGLNSRTMIVIGSRVWVCPWHYLGLSPFL